MTTEQTKRIGRPPKAAAGPKRFALGLKVTAETKRIIDEEARRSGRTQSQVAELLIEKALTYDGMIAAMNQSLEDLRRHQFDAALQREGFRPLNTKYGRGYLPREFPLSQTSGFGPWEEGEYVPPSVELPPLEPLKENPQGKLEIEQRLKRLEALLPKKSENPK
jgi:hypothetical protein